MLPEGYILRLCAQPVDLRALQIGRALDEGEKGGQLLARKARRETHPRRSDHLCLPTCGTSSCAARFKALHREYPPFIDETLAARPEVVRDCPVFSMPARPTGTPAASARFGGPCRPRGEALAKPAASCSTIAWMIRRSAWGRTIFAPDQPVNLRENVMTPNPKIDSYLANAEEFARPILTHLRALLHATCPDVVEEIKWGIPHFDYRGEMMCIFAAHQRHCSFTFWKDALMDDARLRANGDLPAAKRFMGKLTRLADLPPDNQLTGWIREAMSLNERGIKLPPRKSESPKPAVGIPEAFAQQLSANPAVKAIFDDKSASFQKEYNVWIGDAKTDATRDKRIEEALAWIAEGKGRFWKYAK
ncbi:MAG: hypothetical protein JWM65_215 [Sphingomonas bacterium]|nr:hypothetical protein [Sphingomonas bacterium]